MLIDADNASPSIIGGLLSEIAKYGVPTVKRIYGDWTTPNLAGWKAVLLEHAITPIQQFRYTVGKNATDSAMIIDAMDLLYAGKMEGFCLVSSDSDFTRLASRFRESGLTVYGFGERKTPVAFVSACDRFVFVDVLRDPSTSTPAVRAAVSSGTQIDRELVNLLRAAVDAASSEDGWANLASVGAQLTSQKADFDPRHYGYPKLSALFEASKAFELKRESAGGGAQTTVFARAIKPRKERS